jgi:hypothetical protein
MMEIIYLFQISTFIKTNVLFLVQGPSDDIIVIAVVFRKKAGGLQAQTFAPSSFEVSEMS